MRRWPTTRWLLGSINSSFAGRRVNGAFENVIRSRRLRLAGSSSGRMPASNRVIAPLYGGLSRSTAKRRSVLHESPVGSHPVWPVKSRVRDGFDDQGRAVFTKNCRMDLSTNANARAPQFARIRAAFVGLRPFDTANQRKALEASAAGDDLDWRSAMRFKLLRCGRKTRLAGGLQPGIEPMPDIVRPRLTQRQSARFDDLVGYNWHSRLQ